MSDFDICLKNMIQLSVYIIIVSCNLRNKLCFLIVFLEEQSDNLVLSMNYYAYVQAKVRFYSFVRLVNMNIESLYN